MIMNSSLIMSAYSVYDLNEVSSVYYLIIISFVLGLVTALHYIPNSRKSQAINSYKLPPGPKPWPVLGNLPEMMMISKRRNRPASRWIHDIMDQLQTDIACIRLGSVHLIPVRSPEIAREFLRKHDEVFASRPLNMTTGISSGGFLTAIMAPQGEQWRKMRKVISAHVINPATRLKWVRDKLDQESDNLVRFLYTRTSSRSSVVNVRDAVWHFCGNFIRRLLFGRRYFGQGSEDFGPGFEEQEHVEAAFDVVAHIYALSPSDYNAVFRWLDLDGHGKVMKESLKRLTRYQDLIIDERVKQWRDGNHKSDAQDMLDLFILAKVSSGEHLSTPEIKAQCAEMVFAAMDNPCNVVEWAMGELINHQNILVKAIEEIDRVVGKERLVRESDVSSLRYINACLKETFRLHPVSTFLPPHLSTADAIISNHFIPKGSQILLSRSGLGRNPKVWERPLEFEPERHLKENDAIIKLTEPDLKYISFGTGRRACIGFAMGSNMAVVLLATLVQAFSWAPPPGKKEIDLVESKYGLLMLLDQPLHALATPRLPVVMYGASSFSK